jgi:hypothetical protein
MLNLTEANAPPYLAEITAALEENSDVELGSNDDLGIFEVSQRAMMSIDAVLNNFKG